MSPHFENFSLNTLNSEQKPSAKIRLTGQVKNRSTGRSTGDDFEIYRSGRENPDRFHLWSMDRNQEQVPARICLLLEPKRFGINFFLPEQEFLNLGLILFMKGFFQLIAQFSSNLFEECADTTENVVNEFAIICVSVQTSCTDSVSRYAPRGTGSTYDCFIQNPNCLG